MKSVLISGINTNDISVLSDDECNKLFDKFKNYGDLVARERIVYGNLKLVLSCIKNFNNKGDLDDLFQIGVVGLCKAVDNFDPSFGVKLSTYAIPMISGEIRRYLRDNSMLRISRSIKDLAYKSLRLKEELTNELGYVPSNSYIADILGVSVSDVDFSINSSFDIKSIYDDFYCDNNDSILLYETICNDDKISFDDRLILDEGLSFLSDKERDILYKRYIYGSNQVEIAKEFNISQAQVSRIESSAIKSLRMKLK